MSNTLEKLIYKLKELELEENKLKSERNKLLSKLKDVDQRLDQNSTKRGLALKELEMVYNSDQNSQSSDNEFQSVCSENSLYPKSSDLDSDEYTQKRKERSDSTASDVETKKVKTRSNTDLLANRLSSVDEVNLLDQQTVNLCFDEMASDAINDIKESDPLFKDELQKLSSDPVFKSLVNDVEKSPTKGSSKKSPNSVLSRSHSTDGNFKENVAPSSRVRRTSSNRFRFDQQNSCRSPSNYKSNSNVINTQPTTLPYNVLRGRKLLSTLLTAKQTIDERPEKLLTEKVEIVSKDFKQNFSFWEKKTTESVLENENECRRRNSKVVSV